MTVESLPELNAVLNVSGPIYTPGGLQYSELGYTTTGPDSIVSARLDYIGGLIAAYGNEGEDGPQVHIVMPHTPFDNLSYKRELARQSREVGITPHIYQPRCDEEAVEIIAELSDPDRPDVNGIMPLYPFQTDHGEQVGRRRITPWRDPDGTSSEGRLVVPATAPAMAIGAACLYTLEPPEEIHGQGIDVMTAHAYSRMGEQTIGIGTRGRLTTIPLMDTILQSDILAANVAVVLNREDIEAGEVGRLRQCDIVFLAARRARYVRREHLKPGAVVVDVGNTPCPELDDRPAGNLHESTWRLTPEDIINPGQQRRVTAFDHCIGRISASIVLGRAADNWLEQRPGRRAGVLAR